MKNKMISKIMYKGVGIGVLIITMVLCLFPNRAYAAEEKTSVEGNVYKFDEDSKYEFSKAKKFKKSDGTDTYGNFSISGQIANIITKGDIPAYEVSGDNLKLFYNYSDSMLKADEKSWHIVADKGKKIDGLKLDNKIMKGTIVVQTSKDRKNWIDVKTITNAFDAVPVRTKAIYSTTDMQLLNGCYYRVIVAYKTRKMVEPNKILFVTLDDYEYRKNAEVYEFYAYSGSENAETVSDQTHNLGSTVRTKDFDGYSGKTEMDKKDSHYGWDLGNFFVSGYTDKVEDSKGNMIFLKNVGDKVTLWFNLKENIDSLHGNKDLSVTADTEGYDQYFQTPKMNFGKGTLVVRYTDYNNNTSEPQIYTNYLEANATAGADTKVQLFEEGDYEVALDYQITNDQLIDKVAHYRIFFEFSVRNGNCMVYPFDVSNGNELTNSSMTDNGFRLDLAKSRYLKVNIKREMLTDSADGLVEDTRFNGPAKDGAEYTDEGIYTITVSNDYTKQFTTKKIYVGKNKILKAHMTTGLSIPEINNLVTQGATISDEGTIRLATKPAEEQIENKPKNQSSNKTPTSSESKTESQMEKSLSPIVLGIGIICCIGVFIFLIQIKKTKDVHDELHEK